MKKRLLPIGLIAAFTGLSFLFFSLLSMAGQPGKPDLRKHEGSRLETIRANQYTGVVNPQDVLNARLQVEGLHTKSLASDMGLKWISVGPGNYPGLVWSCIFDKTDQSGATLVAGSASGGIWKSINLGLTWTQMPVENNFVPRVSSLVQASNGTIYAATGVTSCKNSEYHGNGIYYSQNGNTFNVIPATQNNTDFQGVAKLAINQQSGRIFAATKGGLYYSDNGTDWNILKSGYAMDVCVGSDGTVIAAVGDSAYMAPGGNVADWVTLTTGQPNTLPKTGIGWMVFAIAPSNVNVMYASLAKPDGKLLNIYVSTDKGVNWSVIFPNNPTFEPFTSNVSITGGAFGCYSNTLAVFPDDPDKILLGGVNLWYGQRIQTAGYFNWEILSSGLYSPWYPDFSAPQFHHSYMFRPNNAQQLVIASDGGVTIATLGGANGITFQTSNKDLITSQFNAISFSAQRSYVMGGGDRIGTLALGYFYPSMVNSPNYGFPLWQPDDFLINGDGGTCEWSNIDSHIAVFTQYRGGTLSGGQAIHRQDFTDLTYVNDFMFGVDTINSAYVPMRLWESFKFTQTHDTVTFYARTDTVPAGTTIMVESANNKFKFPYFTPNTIVKGDSIRVADPIASRYFVYGNKANVRGIYMTKDMLKFDKDPLYFLIHKDTAKVDVITALAVSADLNTAWAGTKAGRLIRISGLIQAYDSATANITSSQCVLVDSVFSYPALKNRYVTSISICPANTNQVLVTLGNYGNQDYVYFTQDGNAPKPVFTSVQSDLPKSPVYSGLLELHGNNAILGTDLGVYSTTNITSGSPQWAPDMQNIGDVAVTDIRQQVIHDYHIQNYGVIYLGSYGRGIWMDTTYYSPVGIDPVNGQPTSYGTLDMNPNPVSDILNISYDHEGSGILVATVYDLSGRTILSTSFGNQPKGTYHGKLNLGDLPKGTYLVKVGNGYGKIVKL